MSHTPELIQDLAVILFSAGITTLIFKWLKQPVVLGYLVAGLIAGPYLFDHTLISEVESITVWGEIGVIFLLFALGLEFSFRKLLNVGGAALIGAMTIVTGMMTMGYLTGITLGWSNMNSIFLGGMLCMSSTTIVFKSLDDLGLRKQRFAGVVFGVLIVEDLFAVLLMVILSTLAVSKEFEGVQMMESIVKLGAYLLFWFVGGIFLIPSFLKHMRKYLNEETLLVVSLGLCLGMVMLAVKAGFSAALGAFVMGSILAETLEAERIDKLIKPVKDLFGAIFFVSVGMLINPSLLAEYWVPILVITIVVIIGQIFFASFGVVMSGEPLKVAMQAGFSLAQIGEFAFIIASLGVSLKVTNDYLYPIVVAVSVITTFLTPYVMKLAEPAYKHFDKRMPLSTRKFIERYSAGQNTISHKSAWNKLLKSLGRILVIYGVISILIVLLFFSYISPLITEYIHDINGKIVSVVIVLFMVSPFLRAIMMKKNHSKEFNELWQDNRFNRGYLVGLVVARIIFCLGIIMFIMARLFTLTYGVIFGVSVMIVISLIYSRFVKKQSIQIERRFLRNLTARQHEDEKKAPVKQKFVKSLLARDMHIEDFEVSPYSPSCGKMLKELNFRQKSGVSIVKIVRGEHHINIPGGNIQLFPYDKLIVAGTDKQIERFKQFVEERKKAGSKVNFDSSQEPVTLEQFLIEPNSRLIGKSIMQSHIRDKADCLVVGIERGAESLLNPAPDVIFEESDVVWVAGERSKLEKLVEDARRTVEQNFENEDTDNEGDDEFGWIVE